MNLIDFDARTFLRDNWQKRPILIRDPWTAWTNPVEPDELAGLACQDGVESRLITGAADQWSLEHGPLPDDRFGALPRSPWTLLVQAVDHHVPAVAALLDSFRFIPNWRVDDVMVSYAVDGGGVGAHFDHYDVFLVQGLGRRRWQVGARCDDCTPLLPHDDLRLLAEFQPTDEWVLEPGDILYVPPGFAHNGVAVGDDCMTYSIGFRAPARSELVAGWASEVVGALADDDRFVDPDFAPQDNPGEIAGPALARLQAMVADTMRDPRRFAEWFGAFSTRPKSNEIDWRPDHEATLADLQAYGARGVPLVRNPASRFAYVVHDSSQLSLFVDGRAFACSGTVAEFAKKLCAGGPIPIDDGLLHSDDAAELVLELINAGSAAFELDD
jgi:50S ribosomal protein L16 3-hydroxylase